MRCIEITNIPDYTGDPDTQQIATVRMDDNKGWWVNDTPEPPKVFEATYPDIGPAIHRRFRIFNLDSNPIYLVINCLSDAEAVNWLCHSADWSDLKYWEGTWKEPFYRPDREIPFGRITIYGLSFIDFLTHSKKYFRFDICSSAAHSSPVILYFLEY